MAGFAFNGTTDPQIHTEWENELSKVIAELAEPPVEISQPSSDLRPHMYNQLAGQLILLDTGAATSIWPASAKDKALGQPSSAPLQTVNGSAIQTFGSKMKQISINGTQYVHSFVLANVDKPITGWPFMLQFKFDLKWTSKGCILVDQRRHMRSYLKIHSVQSNLLGIAPVDQPLDVVPPAYRTLFNQFPGILSPTFQTNPSHGVQHHIKTGQAPPAGPKFSPLCLAHQRR